MDYLKNNTLEVDEFLVKAKKVAKGSTISEAAIDSLVIRVYAKVARRCRDDKDLGLTNQPCESSARMTAFVGDFSEHR